ncbi:hypothetical protein Pla123a_23020 [Posidoniimonas polymericola]|uniref:Uncharacterized protein n=1 Tax=Posidoniimonas polymericola TaxID=2528002 RepID=A0A5C5YQ08_9BACT|nr:hypothetical protein [Posidoniimonas polymericola]TWT76878.1 hypothetical protein Pla123a_23020 [Posidoniimonas polymericola]
MIRYNQTASSRTGGTSFQVVTFILVAGLGAWLGAEYVGVDVEHLAYTALDEAKVIDHIPEQWRPKPPMAELGDAQGQVSFEQRALDLRSELENLRSEVASLRHDVQESSPDLVRELPTTFAEAPPVRRQATLAYWTRLRQIATEVTDLHDSVELALEPATASMVFGIRQRAFDYGARAIESVDAGEVDPQAVDAGFRIAKWYRSGAELYERAAAIWEGRIADAPTEELQRSLETSRSQHAREAELVRDLAARTEEILMRRYAVEFPVLSI